MIILLLLLIIIIIIIIGDNNNNNDVIIKLIENAKIACFYQSCQGNEWACSNRSFLKPNFQN